jgi:hypothetical protein
VVVIPESLGETSSRSREVSQLGEPTVTASSRSYSLSQYIVSESNLIGTISLMDTNEKGTYGAKEEDEPSEIGWVVASVICCVVLIAIFTYLMLKEKSKRAKIQLQNERKAKILQGM